MRKFRLLNESEIECRISEISKEGGFLTLLLYKTARTDAALLDEVMGVENWQNDFKAIDGKIYGGIGIKTDNGWIWKWDCGSESMMDAEKGQASDAFKRAGFKFGIGAELYTAPKIRIGADKCQIKRYGDKFKCYDRFIVEKIAYDDIGNISGIAIKNATINQRCFIWQKQ